MNRLALPALLCAICACSSEPSPDAPRSDPRESDGGRSERALVPPTEYATSLHFLATESARNPALVLQFANMAGPDGVAIRYQGWMLSGSSWRSVLDADFRNEITRAPWRLFPADSLRLTVTADGDPDAIVLRTGAADYTLDLGTHLDAWEDRAGTRHDIRAARYIQRGRAVSGIAVQHRFAIPEPARPSRFGPYERAVLQSEDDAIIVLFHSRRPETYGNSFGWMYADGLTRRWTALEARTVEVANSSQLRRNIPIRTWFHIPEPDIKCELTATVRLLNELTTEDGPKPYNALYKVQGWIEFAGERRSVEGLLELGES